MAALVLMVCHGAIGSALVLLAQSNVTADLQQMDASIWQMLHQQSTRLTKAPLQDSWSIPLPSLIRHTATILWFASTDYRTAARSSETV